MELDEIDAIARMVENGLGVGCPGPGCGYASRRGYGSNWARWNSSASW